MFNFKSKKLNKFTFNSSFKSMEMSDQPLTLSPIDENTSEQQLLQRPSRFNNYYNWAQNMDMHSSNRASSLCDSNLNFSTDLFTKDTSVQRQAPSLTNNPCTTKLNTFGRPPKMSSNDIVNMFMNQKPSSSSRSRRPRKLRAIPSVVQISIPSGHFSHQVSPLMVCPKYEVDEYQGDTDGCL